MDNKIQQLRPDLLTKEEPTEPAKAASVQCVLIAEDEKGLKIFSAGLISEEIDGKTSERVELLPTKLDIPATFELVGRLYRFLERDLLASQTVGQLIQFLQKQQEAMQAASIAQHLKHPRRPV